MHPLLQDSLEIKSMKLGLERVATVDTLLGSPSRHFTAIHVAGTNGKGSVTTKIAKILQEAGKRVGLYTSPHLHTYHERIQINGTLITEEQSDRWLKTIVSTSPLQLSYFELLTLLAFCYFAEQKIDCAVIETGMGGRLDATNIIHPLLSIITSIEMDHVPYLGPTLAAIAYEKAGIVKPGIPLLMGPHAKPVDVFQKIAAHNKCPFFQIQGVFAHYEEENQAIAKQAVTLLPFHLEEQAIQRGVVAVPPCRFEIVCPDDPLVILDVAHNPDGFKRTFERLSYQFPHKKVRVLAAFSADKDIQAILAVIRGHTPSIHLTHTAHPRLDKIGNPCFEQAFQEAYAYAKRNKEILLICGTFFIMHNARLVSRSMKE
jgi:dihydrofolate synthase / folylpolyglutamate synthase